MVSEIKAKDFKSSSSGGKKMHPHKFTLWVAIGSIVMMFAGLTSAYIVKSGQESWQSITAPKIFWYSTGVIMLSSLTAQMALRSFKQREMSKYRLLTGVTLALGIAFIVMQWSGFNQLWNDGVQFKGVSGAGQFLYVIAGLHAVHVLGGVITLLVMFIRAYAGKVKNYNSVPVEIITSYWHFVDILWIYLFIFFIWIG